MGIKGLFAFLTRWEQPVTIETAIKDAAVGIDLFWFLYQTRGDDAALHALLAPFFEYARTVHVVVDGSKMTEERRAVVEERRDQRQETIKIIDELQATQMIDERDQITLDNYKAQLMRQAWKPTRAYIDQITQQLQDQGAILHWPRGEADQALIHLEKENQIDRIVSNDSDLIAMGAEHLLRPVKHGFKQLSKSHLMEQMGFTIEQWDTFMRMVQQKQDILVAYSMVRVYGGGAPPCGAGLRPESFEYIN